MPAPRDVAWNACWIGYDAHPAAELGVFAFRHRFELAAVPAELWVRVSADQRYKLFVNGRFVDFGPQRGDLHHWHYETLDLAPYLRAGENWVAALVWYFDRYSPMAQHSARLGLALEGIGQGTHPDTWEVAKIEGWGWDMLHSNLQPTYIDVGPNEVMDAARLGWGWETGAPAGLAWRRPNYIYQAEERGALSGGTPWMLVPRSLPPMRYEARVAPHQRVERESGLRTPFTSWRLEPGEDLLLDAGELLCAYPRLRLRGPAGATLRVSYAEALFDDEGNKGNRNDVRGKHLKGYQDRFLMDGESHEFETCWWRTWRYLQLESDAPIGIESFDAIETGYPYQVESNFDCDVLDAAALWDVSLRTAFRCAGETYFDCPYYEQLQYVGDTRIQVLIHYFMSRDRALPRQAVEAYAWSVMPDGLTQSRYPSRQTQVIPPFSLWWVAMVYDQWMHDDPALAERYLPLCRGVLAAWDRLQEQDPALSFWCYGDWIPAWRWGVPPGAQRSSLNGFHAWIARLCLARMEGRLEEAASTYASLIFERDGLLHLRTHDDGAATEQAQSYARLAQRLAGLPVSAWPAEALDRARAVRATYYTGYYKNLAVDSPDYFSLMGPWREQLGLGLSTFVEHPEPVRSDCHAWSAHPALGFLESVAGVTSAAPGWARAQVAPRPGACERFAARIAHPAGDLTVRWEGGRLEVASPVPFDLVWGGGTESLPAGSVVR